MRGPKSYIDTNPHPKKPKGGGGVAPKTIDVKPLPDIEDPFTKKVNQDLQPSPKTSVGVKYEYLKHLLDCEVGSTLSVGQDPSGQLSYILKSRTGEILSYVPLADGITPNPEEEATAILKKLKIADIVYNIKGTPDLEGELGDYLLNGNISATGTTVEWKKDNKQNKVFIQEYQPATFFAGDIWCDIKGEFNITSTLTHCSGTVPTIIEEGCSASFTVSANSGYVLPNSITVTGASYTYNKSLGLVTLTNPISDVQISIISDAQEYLCFTAASADSTITLGTVGTTHWSGSTSFDTINWTPYIAGTTGGITLTNIGDKVYFKGTFSGNDDPNNHLAFSMIGSINASNSIMSMCCGDETNSLTIPVECAFFGLFQNCTALKSVPTLPATKVTYGGYAYMFKGCTNIITGQELPATTIDANSYLGMFDGCTSLTTAATILPSLTAYSYCYYQMFRGCTSLITAPSLPAITLDYGCYNNMFKGCTSLINTPPALPASVIAERAYYAMFSGCTRLTTFNTVLPVITDVGPDSFSFMFNGASNLTTITNNIIINKVNTNSFKSMFQNCTSLTFGNISLNADVLADYCYNYMFANCRSLTTPPVLPATNLADYCYCYMFGGCDALATPPELPATTLAEGCYDHMFYYCTSLEVAPVLPATTMAIQCYCSMFRYCTSLTTPPRLPATTLAEACYAGMFYDAHSINRINVLPVKELVAQGYEAMYANCWALKMTNDKSETFKYSWSIPADAVEAWRWGLGMLSGTGGTRTGTPGFGEILYTDYPPIE